MSKSEIQLKFGLIKSYYFDKIFWEENRELCEEFCETYDLIMEGSCCMAQASQVNQSNKELKEKLCVVLEKLFDLNVRIWNGWDNKTYKSKNKIRNYILSYGV